MLGSSNDVNEMKLVATFRMIKKKTFEKDPNSSERDRTAIEGKRVADRVEEAADTTCKSVYLAEAEDSKEMKDIMAAMLDGLSDKEEDAEDKYDEIAEKVKSSLLERVKMTELKRKSDICSTNIVFTPVSK